MELRKTTVRAYIEICNVYSNGGKKKHQHNHGRGYRTRARLTISRVSFIIQRHEKPLILRKKKKKKKREIKYESYDFQDDF